jgi:hypothetical protein
MENYASCPLLRLFILKAAAMVPKHFSLFAEELWKNAHFQILTIVQRYLRSKHKNVFLPTVAVQIYECN